MSKPEPYGSRRAEWIKNDTERQLKEAFLFVMLDRSRWLEALSGWLLVITGAGFPLLLSNVQDLLSLISPQRFRLAILLLTVSSLLGVLVRVRTSLVNAMRRTYEDLMPRVKEISDQEIAAQDDLNRDAAAAGQPAAQINVDIKAVIDNLISSTPWYARSSFEKSTKNAITDITLPLKNAVRASELAWWTTILQIATFLIAMALLVSAL